MIPPAAHVQRLRKGRLSGCVCVDVVSAFIMYSCEDRREDGDSSVLLSKLGLFCLMGRLEALVALKNNLWWSRASWDDDCACFLLHLSPVSPIMKFYFELLIAKGHEPQLTESPMISSLYYSIKFFGKHRGQTRDICQIFVKNTYSVWKISSQWQPPASPNSFSFLTLVQCPNVTRLML